VWPPGRRHQRPPLARSPVLATRARTPKRRDVVHSSFPIASKRCSLLAGGSKKNKPPDPSGIANWATTKYGPVCGCGLLDGESHLVARPGQIEYLNRRIATGGEAAGHNDVDLV
jgi:hypothetical protein